MILHTGTCQHLLRLVQHLLLRLGKGLPPSYLTRLVCTAGNHRQQGYHAHHEGDWLPKAHVVSFNRGPAALERISHSCRHGTELCRRFRWPPSCETPGRQVRPGVLSELGRARPRNTGSVRAPGNRGVDQGVGLGCVHREAAEGITLVLGGDRRQRGEVRAPAPRRRVPYCRAL